MRFTCLSGCWCILYFCCILQGVWVVAGAQVAVVGPPMVVADDATTTTVVVEDLSYSSGHSARIDASNKAQELLRADEDHSEDDEEEEDECDDEEEDDEEPHGEYGEDDDPHNLGVRKDRGSPADAFLPTKCRSPLRKRRGTGKGACEGLSAGIATQWFQSYLANRSHAVRLENTISSPIQNDFGVPQGSILGPLLFSIFISDFPSMLSNTRISMYADDIQIAMASVPAKLFQTQINAEILLKHVKSWYDQNGLNLNASKTQCIIFGSKNTIKKLPNLTLTLGNDITELLFLVKSNGSGELVKQLLEMPCLEGSSEITSVGAHVDAVTGELQYAFTACSKTREGASSCSLHVHEERRGCQEVLLSTRPHQLLYSTVPCTGGEQVGVLEASRWVYWRRAGGCT
ncbi:Reverse transcriptase domain, partial [Trinorchestia longiramus]